MHSVTELVLFHCQRQRQLKMVPTSEYSYAVTIAKDTAGRTNFNKQKKEAKKSPKSKFSKIIIIERTYARKKRLVRVIFPRDRRGAWKKKLWNINGYLWHEKTKKRNEKKKKNNREKRGERRKKKINEITMV